MDRGRGSLAGMAIFVQVVDAGGFSAAARDLGLSKSAVSKHIDRLESDFGARLLNRTTRRISLTEAGAALYESCSRIAAELESAELRLTRFQSAPRGTLRINAPVSFGQLHLAPAIPDFLRLHPEVNVDLTLNDRVVDLVDEGYDLAVRIAALPDSSLIARRLAPCRRVVCGAPAYLRKHGEPQSPADLTNANCLNYTYLATRDEWRFRGRRGEIAVSVSGNFRANNGDVLREAAIAGLGLVLLPTFIVGDDLRRGGLRVVLAEYPISETAVSAVYPHSRHESPKLRAWIEFLAKRFGPAPYWDRDLSF